MMKVLLLILLVVSCESKKYTTENAYEMLQCTYPKAIVFSIPGSVSDANSYYISEFIVCDSSSVSYVKVNCYDSISILNKIIIKQ